MASFMKEDLSDELASLPAKLSAVDLWLSRGQAQIHGGNNLLEGAGEVGHQQPTHSPLLGYNSRLIFFVMQPPALVLQGRTVLQAPLKPVNKGCKGCRMGLVLLFDCTWHAVIKWAIHPALPFSDSLREWLGGKFRVDCSHMEIQAHPLALALIDLEICASEGAFFCLPFPVASFCGGCSGSMRL